MSKQLLQSPEFSGRNWYYCRNKHIAMAHIYVNGYKGVSLYCRDYKTLILWDMVQNSCKVWNSTNGFLPYSTSLYILKL